MKRCSRLLDRQAEDREEALQVSALDAYRREALRSILVTRASNPSLSSARLKALRQLWTIETPSMMRSVIRQTGAYRAQGARVRSQGPRPLSVRLRSSGP